MSDGQVQVSASVESERHSRPYLQKWGGDVGGRRDETRVACNLWVMNVCSVRQAGWPSRAINRDGKASGQRDESTHQQQMNRHTVQ